MKQNILNIGFGTDKGNVRHENQDSLYVNLGKIGKHHYCLIAVADGMGGSGDGKFASSLVVGALDAWWRNVLPEMLSTTPDLFLIRDSLKSALVEANKTLWNQCQARCPGSGSTVSAAFVFDCHLIYVHVGDSRIYLTDSNSMLQITKDHTWCQQEIEAGNLSPEEAALHPKRHVLANVVGVTENVAVESGYVLLEMHNKIVICSDGLYGFLTNEEIFKLLKNEKNIQKAVSKILKNTLKTAARDNVSVILLSQTRKLFNF